MHPQPNPRQTPPSSFTDLKKITCCKFHKSGLISIETGIFRIEMLRKLLSLNSYRWSIFTYREHNQAFVSQWLENVAAVCQKYFNYRVFCVCRNLITLSSRVQPTPLGNHQSFHNKFMNSSRSNEDVLIGGFSVFFFLTELNCDRDLNNACPINSWVR